MGRQSNGFSGRWGRQEQEEEVRGDSEERREGWRGRLRLARRVSRDAGLEMVGIEEKKRSASVGAVRAAE